MIFDDCWNDQCDSSKDVGVEDVLEQVEQGIKSLEKVEPWDLQEEAFVDVTRPENQKAEGASLRQHHNVVGEDVDDKKVK